MKIIFIILFCLVCNPTIASSVLPNPASFNWTYDYWINKKYTKANNNVYAYTKGQVTGKEYLDMVLDSILETNEKQIEATEKLTNLCYLINKNNDKNNDINISNCLLGNLDSETKTMLTYIVSLNYHKEKLENCISITQSQATNELGINAAKNAYDNNYYNNSKTNTINNCQNLGYGIYKNPELLLTNMNIEKDNSFGQKDGNGSYYLKNIDFSKNNRPNISAINNIISDIDCEYLLYKNRSDYNLYCRSKSYTAIQRMNEGLDSCSDIERVKYKSSSNKKTISERHMDGHEIWGATLIKSVGRKSGNRNWYFYIGNNDNYNQVKKLMSNRYMRKNIDRTCRNSLTGNSGPSSSSNCGQKSCANGQCYTNIQCKNAGNYNSSYIRASYPELENAYYVFTANKNNYSVLDKRLEFNSKAKNFINKEMGKVCLVKNISRYKNIKTSVNLWYGLNNGSFENVKINNPNREYIADPMLKDISAGNPKLTASKEIFSYSYCL